MFWWVLAAALIWLAILALPWRPWDTREHVAARAADAGREELSRITALIPARNEAATIADTLRRVAAQGPLARIVLVDDESEDGTGDIARGLGLPPLRVLAGRRPPPGWSGKLWALHQGLAEVDTEFVLLLDADIALEPGILATLAAKLIDEERDMVSVMAALSMHTPWEKLLIPAFIYFFKMLYPFALANSKHRLVAAAAGGCILIRSARLRAIGGFEALRTALIDDCTLARIVKNAGGRIWLGLSHDVRASRPYDSLAAIWNMVARTAYTQLRYSPALLALCTFLLVLVFVVPVLGLVAADAAVRACAGIALLAMMASYLPVLRYYDRHWAWALSLPLAAALYLAMTWTSAWRYLRGERSRWKNRVYDV
ncbi:MAG TPA: glycosyltransferase [Gammaproteobacteria bacterium]|nr:glycosyltransferase [Gammaproteobacteria bacterium]